MEDAVIYVAGDPNAYPVEYYDPESGTYKGLIPELLRQFSEQSAYDVRYYDPEKGDRRQSLAEDLQVDLISDGGMGGTFRHSAGGEILLLESEQNGETVVYQLLVTDVAPEGLAVALRSFLSGIAQTEQNGLLIQSARNGQSLERKPMRIALTAAGIAVLVLLIAVIMLVRHYRRRIRLLEQDKESDPATGIGNKQYFERNFDLYINDRNKILYRILYLFVDTERLDRQNGRRRTDEYLRYVALTLRDHAGDADILARINDGGFILARQSVDDREEQEWMRPVLERLRNAPVEQEAGAKPFYAIGSYQIRPTDRDLYGMIFDASECARSAYLDGEEFRACTDDLIEALAIERQFREDMRKGLENREFALYLQFYVDGYTGAIVGGEALSRWAHPGRGLLLPGDFLPIMEREHLVSALDYRCLENACAFMEGLNRTEERQFFVSCNFSAETFSTPDFPENCRKVIERYRFPRNRMVFELKEAGIAGDAEQVRQNIRELKKMGVSVALDDFGGLFASFAEVENIPLDIVKIGRQVVNGIGSKGRESVLRAMIHVCRELGFGVMAEGVETAEQADFLREEGCNAFQGFYFYRPMPEREARRRIVAGNPEL